MLFQAAGKANRISSFFLILLPMSLLLSSPAWATYHMVTPAGNGSRSGVDWNNALAGNTLLNNGTLIRGDVYCIGSGIYAHWSLSQADSGTQTIELRAAIASDANCGSSVAGWSSAMDTSVSPATIRPTDLKPNTWAYAVNIASDYWLINGNGRGSPKSGYHLRVDNSWPYFVPVAFGTSNTTGVTIEYVEAIGGGMHEDATEYALAASASRSGSMATVTITPNCNAGYRCAMPWFNGQYVTVSGMTNHPSFNCTACQISSVSGNSFSYTSAGTSGETDSGEGQAAGMEAVTDELVRAVGGISNFTLAYSYLHNTNNSPVQVSGITNSSIHDNVIAGTTDTPVNHGNGIMIDLDNGLNVYNNVFEDTFGTGDVTTGGNHDSDANLAIYNNVFMCHPGDPFHNCDFGNGVIQLIAGNSVSNNISIYQNTAINIGGLHNGVQISPGTVTGYCNIQNNLFYGGSALGLMILNGCVGDHNSWLNMNLYSTPGSQDVYAPSGAPNPFRNWAGTCTTAHPGDMPVCSGEDYTLVSDNPDWNNRLALSAPFNTDAAGHSFTTDRGAYQFGGSTSTVDAIPPTVAIASPANGATVSGTITVSGTAADNVAVAGVQVSVDGGAYVSASGTTNWTFSLNTTSLTNASHTISAKATDTSGNVSTAASISVTANNAVFSPCDINKDGVTNVMDVQLEVNAALGVIACAPAYDLNQDGLCNVIDVQRVVNAALGGKCVVGP